MQQAYGVRGSDANAYMLIYVKNNAATHSEPLTVPIKSKENKTERHKKKVQSADSDRYVEFNKPSELKSSSSVVSETESNDGKMRSVSKDIENNVTCMEFETASNSEYGTPAATEFDFKEKKKSNKKIYRQS